MFKFVHYEYYASLVLKLEGLSGNNLILKIFKIFGTIREQVPLDSHGVYEVF